MKVSASNLGLLAHCRYYARPEVKWPWDPMGPAAAFGVALHALAETAVILDDVRSPPESAPKYKELDAEQQGRLARVWALLAQWIYDNRKATWKPELKLAWDHAADRGRVLPSAGPRDYSAAKAEELTGTADVVSVEDGTVYVYDFKSGKAEADSYAPQMRALSLFAARAFGVDRAVAVVVKANEDGIFETRYELDGMELDAIAAELAGYLAAVPDATPTPGTHCTEMYCKLRAVCPSTVAAVESLAPSDARVSLVVVTEQAAITGPGHAAFILHRLRAIDAMRDKAWEALKGYVVTNGPVPIGDGKEYRMCSSTRESVDGKAALALAKAKGATEYELGKCIKTAVVTSAREAKAS